MATNRASLIAASIGLSIIAFTASAGAAQPPSPPTPAITTVTASCMEDEPCWTCSPNDDRCGSPDEGIPDDVAIAWQSWEASDNALQLGNQPTRIEYVGRSDVPIPGHMLVNGYLFLIIYPTI